MTDSPTQESLPEAESEKDRLRRIGWCAQMVNEYYVSAGFSPEDAQDETRRFFEFFSGKTFTVPEGAVIEKFAIESQIIISIAKDPSAGNLRRLADLHNVPRMYLAKLVRRLTSVGLTERRKEEALKGPYVGPIAEPLKPESPAEGHEPDRQHCRHPRHTHRVRIRI